MPTRQNRKQESVKGPKSLSEGLKQGGHQSNAMPSSLKSQLHGSGKGSKGSKAGLKTDKVGDVKTDITFGGEKAMSKKTMKKK